MSGPPVTHLLARVGVGTFIGACRRPQGKTLSSAMTVLTVNIATWLERRLDMSLGYELLAARLYGIVVNDPLGLLDDLGQPARTSFIDEASDAFDLLAGSCAVLARSFDAAAIVTLGWAAPIADGGEVEPSRDPRRRRVRIVTVVNDEGCASAIRFADDPDLAVAQSELHEGNLVAALQSMWFGDGHDLVNSRTTARGCRRRL